jgi:Uma2 family endonuclease
MGRMSIAYSTYVGPPGVGPISLPVSPLSTDQYLRIIDAGILDDDNVELIGGVITAMAPIGPEHNSSLYQLTEMFARVVDQVHLSIQSTVVFSEGNVFQPDLALIRRKAEGYKRALPRPEDVLLVVESSASSLPRDRHVKLPVYAATGIQEYWIADLEREVLVVYRDPQGARYRSERSFTGEEVVSPLACPELKIRVADIFK